MVQYSAAPVVQHVAALDNQAWIEQKNGSVVRRFVGHERYCGPMAGQTMAHLYGAMRLYVNHFQPSFQLLERNREGGSVKKRYSPPATPCDRLLWCAEQRESGALPEQSARAMATGRGTSHARAEEKSASGMAHTTGSRRGGVV